MFELVDFRVDDALTLRAYQVWVRVGFVAIVPVAAVSKADLKDLSELFQQGDRLVDGRQAGGREIDLDLLINPLDARVLITVKERLEDGDTLRCDTKLTLAELVEDFIQPVLWVFHLVTICIRSQYG